jgi:hypothetical protein
VLVADLVRPGATVVLDGAHAPWRVGLLARLVGPRGAVHVLEADPVLAALVGPSLTETEAAVVRLANAGLGATTGRTEIAAAASYRIRLGGTPRVRQRGRARLRAETVTLDDYVSAARLQPSLVVTPRGHRLHDLVGGADRTLRARPAIWLVTGLDARGVPPAFVARGYTLFDPATYRPLDGPEFGAAAGCLAIPSGPLRTVAGRWRRAPRLVVFESVSLFAACGSGGEHFQSDYIFLPAGRWLITLRLDVAGRSRIRSVVLDSVGRRLSVAGGRHGARSPTTHVHALALETGEGVSISTRARDAGGEILRGSLTVEEVRFP